MKISQIKFIWLIKHLIIKYFAISGECMCTFPTIMMCTHVA